jgi:hypothetical protein
MLIWAGLGSAASAQSLTALSQVQWDEARALAAPVKQVSPVANSTELKSQVVSILASGASDAVKYTALQIAFMESSGLTWEDDYGASRQASLAPDVAGGPVVVSYAGAGALVPPPPAGRPGGGSDYQRGPGEF